MPISSLLTELAADLRDPGLMWQIGVIAVCIVAGWGSASLMRARIAAREAQEGIVRFGVEGFSRVVGPLLIVLLLAVSKYVMGHWQHVNLVRLALPLFGSLAVIRFGFFLLRRVFARRGTVGATVLTLEKIFALLVWLAVALYITGLYVGVFAFLDQTELPLGRHKVSLAAILQGALSVAVLLMLALWAGAALEERLLGVQGVHLSLRVVMARMSRAVLIVVAVLLSLSLVGIDLTVLSVFGGALGVGLGLGLQKIASNYVSGFVILLERSLAIGDMITVDRFSGKVTQINTRYTVLQGLDGIESVLPNEMLISGPVQNYSLTDRKLRIATQLTVDFATDLAALLPKLEAAAASVERVLADPPPSASFVKFGECGFDLDVGLWIGDPENGRLGVLSDVNRKIWQVLQDEGVSLPYPVRDVRVTSLPETAVVPGVTPLPSPA